ncbi:hypothetical protein ACQP3J_32145, partial [Escherichia coli]
LQGFLVVLPRKIGMKKETTDFDSFQHLLWAKHKPRPRNQNSWINGESKQMASLKMCPVSLRRVGGSRARRPACQIT